MGRKRRVFTDLRILGGSRPGGGGVHADPGIKLPPGKFVLPHISSFVDSLFSFFLFEWTSHHCVRS